MKEREGKANLYRKKRKAKKTREFESKVAKIHPPRKKTNGKRQKGREKRRAKEQRNEGKDFFHEIG